MARLILKVPFTQNHAVSTNTSKEISCSLTMTEQFIFQLIYQLQLFKQMCENLWQGHKSIELICILFLPVLIHTYLSLDILGRDIHVLGSPLSLFNLDSDVSCREDQSCWPNGLQKFWKYAQCFCWRGEIEGIDSSWNVAEYGHTFERL